ncbi:MAG: hypothetical protein ACKVI3_19100 [Verrucomicrobiia bacterium]|tara:strand:- start:604 stop:1383 length:780 start_codon:yes stop_codon:yes gene_type:complete
MRPRRLLLAPLFVLTLIGSTVTTIAADSNPAQAGFNLAESDAKAIAIADATMVAMGGRKAWDNTRHVTWRFFGNRLHVWDKFTGDHRFENKDVTVLSNLNTGEGRAWKAGVEITDRTERSEALTSAKGAWINDAYWLAMPYKLKDSGVTLQYVGVKDDPAGATCDVLQLTFQEVGNTPDNKYNVYVDQDTGLVSQWMFWHKFDDAEARDLGPWTDWKKHGDILLAHGHGKRDHTDIGVFQVLPASVYSDPAAFVIADHK